MNQWTPLWSMIVESSLWQDEDDATCKVFITMMAIKDPDHVVRFSAYQIGKKANKTEKEVLEALKILSSPDKRRLEPQEFEGRRIEKRPDGWFMLNGQKYQDMMQDIIRQRQQAQWQREQRMIERAVRTGEGLNPADVTPKIRERYERAKAKANGKSRKEMHDDRTGERGLKAVEDNCENGSPMPPSF